MQRLFFLALILVGLIFTTANAAPAPTATFSETASSNPLHAGQREVIAIVIDVPEGLHAQSHTPLEKGLIALSVSIDPQPGISVGPAIYPEGKIENYPLLGKVSVYTGRVIVYVPIDIAADARGPITLNGGVLFQLCDDKQCFIPPRKPLPFTIETSIALQGSFKSALDEPIFAGFDRKLLAAPIGLPDVEPTTRAAAVAPPADTGSVPTSLIGAVALALLVGVIFNVMPCVLPVLPLKAVGFYEAAQHDRGKTITFGLLFSAGMISIFTALAIAVVASKSLFGRQIQWGEQFAHPGFVWPMAAILAFLGVSMLGVFAFKLPTGIYGFNFRHDTLIGNFLWGGLTAVLATPCTAPLFPPLLAYAIAQPPVSGFITMVAVGVGMALPYLILSAFPQLARKFPRTGPFAELFKQMMGFLLLGTAAWFVGIRLCRDPNQWWLVFGVVVIASAFLIFRTRQILPTPRAISIAVMLALLFTATGLGTTLRLTSVPFGWHDYTVESAAEARKSGQIVLVEFTASWCLNCKYIEQTVYQNPRVRAELQKRNVITLKADMTDYTSAARPLLEELGGTGIPFTAIYPADGDKPLTLESIYTADTLIATLDQAETLKASH